MTIDTMIKRGDLVVGHPTEIKEDEARAQSKMTEEMTESGHGVEAQDPTVQQRTAIPKRKEKLRPAMERKTRRMTRRMALRVRKKL
jgi:hypothetical protein